MKANDKLRIHIINVGHGDSILVEFPDYLDEDGNRQPRFGLVDAGGDKQSHKDKTVNYINTFLDVRTEGNDHDYRFEFICLTHPHQDHYWGLMKVLEHFCDDQNPRYRWPREFWDSGFRYNTLGYLTILNFLDSHRQVQFMRVTSGTEMHFGDVEVLVLAPSVDLRNRYDTYGVEVNDASIVLRLTRGKGVAILTGDAHFDSWGKISEEFPRSKHITYPPQGGDLRDPNHQNMVYLSQENQLRCHFLKVSHHGSKNGTSYECIHKLKPSRFAITRNPADDYEGNWINKFPHPITRRVLGEFTEPATGVDAIPALTDLHADDRVCDSATHGTMIYTIKRSRVVDPPVCLLDSMDQDVDAAALENSL